MLIKRWIFVTLMKLRLDFLSWTVLRFWNTSGGFLTQTFNSQTLRGDWHLLKSQKYWNCKALLGIITNTITQLNYLFLLYYSSSYCQTFDETIDEMAQFINNYQKSAPGIPITKQFVLQSCFLCITEAY